MRFQSGSPVCARGNPQARRRNAVEILESDSENGGINCDMAKPPPSPEFGDPREQREHSKLWACRSDMARQTQIMCTANATNASHDWYSSMFGASDAAQAINMRLYRTTILGRLLWHRGIPLRASKSQTSSTTTRVGASRMLDTCCAYDGLHCLLGALEKEKGREIPTAKNYF